MPPPPTALAATAKDARVAVLRSEDPSTRLLLEPKQPHESSRRRRRTTSIQAPKAKNSAAAAASARAVDLGCDTVQVFTQRPRAWRPTNHKPESFERFRERRAEAGIGDVVCHALYLVNLASPDDELYRKSVDSLRNTIEVAGA